MAESLIESQRESPKRRALHALLKGLAFVPNLVFAALAGSLLAAPISLLLFHIFPSAVAACIQDVTTLLLFAGTKRPMWTSAAGLESCPATCVASSLSHRLIGQLFQPQKLRALPGRIVFSAREGVRGSQ